MKKHLPAQFLFLFISISLFSCTPDYQDLGKENISELLIKNQWNVQVINANTSYNYKDFTLGFDQRGLAVFNMNQSQVFGSWNLVDKNISLMLNATEVSVQQLNRTWNITSQTAGSIRFTCSDPSSGDQLVLTKK